ncbi:type VI secretion system baseplate subunit TssK [Massilia forsythiae]|uniref:Type VI secretion system baseplate subunit TssK n=1 Tax=Massilia forsythiae TaxID=2728020 RepID=A0A7Z2VVR8_9BURK|nr:type VI secretion system baseplate subunit TssK [Massilia forsythiae]QJE00030.1 type VI secretion system baseplate subunit TssK [Massilia forsythiae]
MSSKVLWGEGLLLRPQHFQRQDAYHEHRLHKGVKAANPYAWGVERLQLDRDALADNVLRILDLALRFQDGELVDAPGSDELPPTIDLSQLGPAQQSVTYYAALPGLKPFNGNFAQPGQPTNTVRFLQANQETPDLYTQASAVQVAYLTRTVRLVAEFEPRDAYIHFPLLRLRRAATGGFELDPAFVPPSLSVEAAPPLFQQLRRLLDALQAKVSALYGHHREPSRNVIEFRSGDMSSFWLLHTASAAHAALAHHYHHPALHPERLYEQLLAVAGGLLTFSRSWTLADLPPYRHDDPGPAFFKLHQIIRELLDTVISSKYFAIALSEARPSYHLGMLDSGKIDDKTTFYIAVSADIPALELVDVVPLRFKVGAPDDVEKCVLSALPGVRLQYAPQLPAAVPVRPDTCYFTLDPKGQMYERMLQAQSISIYVPSGIKELTLELLAVAA